MVKIAGEGLESFMKEKIGGLQNFLSPSCNDGLFRSHTLILRICHEMKILLSKVIKLKVMISRHLGE